MEIVDLQKNIGIIVDQLVCSMMIFMFHFAVALPSRIIQVEKRPEEHHDLHFLTIMFIHFFTSNMFGGEGAHFSPFPLKIASQGTPSCRTKDSCPTVSELNLGGNN